MPNSENAQQSVFLDDARLAHVLQFPDPLIDPEGVEPQGPDFVFVQGDLDEAIPPPLHLHCRDAVYLQQLGNQLVVHMGPQGFQRIGTGECIAEKRPLLLTELLGYVGLD